MRDLRRPSRLGIRLKGNYVRARRSDAEQDVAGIAGQGCLAVVVPGLPSSIELHTARAALELVAQFRMAIDGERGDGTKPT